MRIQNNVSSLNAWRNLTSTDGAMSKSLERLSSGYQINRAADDAAGLAISERMRAQIRGMNQAIKNAQDGISLVQTAEGALNEVHTILQRMRELAVQAANGSNTGADRNQIQSEVDQLASEVTRITNTTRYNSKELLNGAMQATVAGPGGGTGQLTFQIGALANQTISFSVQAMDAFTLGIARDVREVSDNNNALNTINVTSATTADNGVYDIKLTENGSGAWDVTISTGGGPVIATAAGVSAGGTATLALTNGTTLDIDLDQYLTTTAGSGVVHTAQIELNVAQSAQFANGAKTADAVTVGGLDVTTEANATAAISALDTAINTVSAQRSQLGSVQNRLEHTINNLSTVSENLTASESRIRDVDMAAEMANFTKQQILMQAGTAMLAQANAKNQAVLSLLQ
jgi:flagellin